MTDLYNAKYSKPPADQEHGSPERLGSFGTSAPLPLIKLCVPDRFYCYFTFLLGLDTAQTEQQTAPHPESLQSP